MEIAIFESVLIESALTELEAEGKKYDGLYVDMGNAPERKYVKDKAAEINGLLKKIDRARIDASKNYKVEVEKQALAITTRLTDANSNFQVLIDDYNLERKKVLDAEKLRKQLILDAEQLELDHEMGLLINKTYEFDRAEAARIQDIELKRIMDAANKAADGRQKQAIIDSLQREKNEENARLANKEHCSFVNNEVLCSLAESCNLTDEQAKAVVIAIAKNKIPYTAINY